MKEKIIKFFKFNKGYLLSVLAVLCIYPVGYLIMNSHLISINDYLPIIPTSFVGVFVFSLPFRLILKEDKNE